MTIFAWLTFAMAALLEVGGDAVIRRGLRGGSLAVISLGCALLGLYGLVVNSVSWDFSKMLGVYVAFFALASLLYGRFSFDENVPVSTWVGCTLIAAGGLVIQFGSK